MSIYGILHILDSFSTSHASAHPQHSRLRSSYSMYLKECLSSEFLLVNGDISVRSESTNKYVPVENLTITQILDHHSGNEKRSWDFYMEVLFPLINYSIEYAYNLFHLGILTPISNSKSLLNFQQLGDTCTLFINNAQHLLPITMLKALNFCR